MNGTQGRFQLRTVALGALVAISCLGWTQDTHAGAKGTDRPMVGSCDTEVTPKSPPGEVPIILAIDLTCRLTHLGLTTGGTDREVVVPAGPPNGSALPIAIVIETITYIAANGDKLKSMFAGQGSIDLATGKAIFFGTETFNGGTGRFRNATGSSQTSGEASLLTNKGFLTISGSVNY
jgi:hypothetical protein